MWTNSDEALDLPFTFLGLPEPNDPESAQVFVWPIPYEGTTSYRSGTRSGPQAIIDASRYVETYDEETGRELADTPIMTLPGVAPILGDGDAMMSRIEKLAGEIIRPERFIVSLGGEHSISGPLIRAHKAVFGELTVVQIDAHADLRPSYEGSKTSHASVMRRANEVANTLGIGIRAISKEEADWLHGGQTRSEIIFAHELRREPHLALDRIAKLRGNVYLTVDLDALDPSIMPGVGTPEPGGLGWYELTELVRALAKSTTIVGADVVELAPVPGNVVSEFTAARLVAKIIAYRCINSQVT